MMKLPYIRDACQFERLCMGCVGEGNGEFLKS